MIKSLLNSIFKRLVILIFPIIQRINAAIEKYKLERTLKSLKRYGQGVRMQFPYRIMNPKYISIGNNFDSLYNLRLEAWDSYGSQKFIPEISIGNNVSINTDVHIGCINKIIIGDNVLMASRIYISDHSHGMITANALDLPPVKRPLFSKGPVIIKSNVWVGEGVCILPGVTIGENAIIGANSVVTKDIPPNTVVAGIPATVIKLLN